MPQALLFTYQNTFFMKSILLTIGSIIVCTTNFYAQQTPKYFEQKYNIASDAMEFRILLPTADNNYLLVGNYINYNIGKSNPCLTKVNAHGDTLWHKSYTNGNKEFVFLDIVTTNYGYAIAANQSDSYIVDTCGSYVLFMDTEGNILSQADTPNENFDSYAYKINNTLDGGYLLSGYVSPYDYEWRATKLNALGMVEWDSIYVLPVHSNQIRDVIVAPDGSGYYLCGFVAWDWYAFPYRQADMALMKIDLNGVPQWYKQYDPAEDDRAIGVTQTIDGNFIISGASATEQVIRAKLLKVDSLGNEEGGWSQSYLINSKSEIDKIIELPNHTLVSMGNTTDVFGTGIITYDYEGLIQKTDSVGNLLWQRIYGGERDDYFYDMIALPKNDGYIMVGRSDTVENNVGKAYAWLVKTNCMGLLTQPVAHFTRTQDALTANFQNLSQFVYPDSIDGGHYIWDFGDGNTSTQANPTHTYAQGGAYNVTLTAVVCSDTSTYTEVVGVWATGIASPTQQQNAWVEISPNPAQDAIQIQHHFADNQSGNFCLFSLDGQLLQKITLVGDGNYTVGTQAMASGVYFYTLEQDGNLLQRNKIIIIK